MSEVYSRITPGDFVRVSPNKHHEPSFLGFVVNAGNNSIDAYVFIPGLPYPQYLSGIVHKSERNELNRPIFDVIPNPIEAKIRNLDERLRQLERKRTRGQLYESDTDSGR